MTTIKKQLVVDVEYDLSEVPPEHMAAQVQYLEQSLKDIIDSAVSDGAMTGSSPAMLHGIDWTVKDPAPSPTPVAPHLFTVAGILLKTMAQTSVVVRALDESDAVEQVRKRMSGTFAVAGVFAGEQLSLFTATKAQQAAEPDTRQMTLPLMGGVDYMLDLINNNRNSDYKARISRSGDSDWYSEVTVDVMDKENNVVASSLLTLDSETLEPEFGITVNGNGEDDYLMRVKPLRPFEDAIEDWRPDAVRDSQRQRPANGG